jgi:hypothetical protein
MRPKTVQKELPSANTFALFKFGIGLRSHDVAQELLKI